MAELPSSIHVPVAGDLRPYFVLEVEAELEGGTSRFGGWWAAVWSSSIPCMQIGIGDGYPVGRAIAIEDDGATSVRRDLLAQAAFFVTTRASSLATAREVGVRTLFVPDGEARVDPLPKEVTGFEGCRVLRAPTAFRRDLLLQDVQREFERLAPGILRRDLGESARCRERLRCYLGGKLADLGHGGCKILPDAVGVDFFKYDADDWIGDVRDLYFFGDQSFDAVYSSHCLEDLWDPRQALEEWSRILRIGGHLSLYLPLRDFYPNVGTEGANPGHKDDYVPEDVEEFAKDLGNLDVVRSERFENEDSFEVILRKRAGRSFYLPSGNSGPAAGSTASGLPGSGSPAHDLPQVSLLIVENVDSNEELAARRLRTTIACAEQSLAGVPHETLVLVRTRHAIDDRASLGELAILHRSVRIIEDRTPMPYPARVALLARQARADFAIHLLPGTVPIGSALAHLFAAASTDGGFATARAIGIDGTERSRQDAVVAATCVATRTLASDAFARSAYHTPLIFEALREDHATSISSTNAWVLTGGVPSIPDAGRGFGQLAFDRSLLARRRPATSSDDHRRSGQRVLFVCLRTFGDAILSTVALDAIAREHPNARIDVLTEASNAWIYASHERVERVVTCPPAAERISEELAIHRALFGCEPQDGQERSDYDRFVLCSPRLDNASYCDAGGMRLASYYAAQAGVRSARGVPVIRLPEDAARECAALRARLSLDGSYAVLHTKAGWDSKSPTPRQAIQIVDRLASHGLPVVIVGGTDEYVDHPKAINIAGTIPAPTSAALIAGAACYVGPDSGCLHLASAFGVPSLALFAGSHPWIAPPLATGSTSLLSFTSCVRPCGRSCRDKTCDMRGITHDQLETEIDALVERAILGNTPTWDTATHRILCDGAEVTWIDGRDGPERLEATACAGNVVDLATNVMRGVRTATALAPIHAISLGEPASELQRIRYALAESNTPEGHAVHHSPQLETVLAGLDRRTRLDALITLAAHAAHDSNAALAISWLERAALHLRATITGENGRARPAYSAWLDVVFAFLTTVPPSGKYTVASITEHALAFWFEHLDTALSSHTLLQLGPACRHAPESLRNTIADNLETIEEHRLGYGELRRCSAALRLLERNDRALQLIDSRRRRIQDPELLGNLAWDKAIILLEDETRRDELASALLEASRFSDTEATREVAGRLLATLPTTTTDSFTMQPA
ncbi:MAG: methyltransferase domain-containing protein [Planctomycetes bacterium]|nr:methyltransferase domain-containing protein [Planctomycetota bacterium]MCB9890456.1 methyltransferase domain-containing protein [Planctomycetota bacterium]MCB9917697.1 methyltransferase domain-containing protein [Planctomycetota bacterium]